jgi:hypothetical protein
MNPTAKITELLGCIDGLYASEAGAIFDLRFLLFFSSRGSPGRNFKILRAKKGAQEAFDDEID